MWLWVASLLCAASVIQGIVWIVFKNGPAVLGFIYAIVAATAVIIPFHLIPGCIFPSDRNNPDSRTPLWHWPLYILAALFVIAGFYCNSYGGMGVLKRFDDGRIVIQDHGRITGEYQGDEARSVASVRSGLSCFLFAGMTLLVILGVLDSASEVKRWDQRQPPMPVEPR